MLTDAQIDAIWSEKPRSFYDHSRAIEQAVIEAGASGAAQDAAWQPIETAPESKDDMLVFSRSGVIRIETGYYAINMMHAAKIDGEDCEYTHWMLLPNPPAAIDEAVEAQQPPPLPTAALATRGPIGAVEPVTDERIRAACLAHLGIMLNGGGPPDHREPCDIEICAMKAAILALSRTPGAGK